MTSNGFRAWAQTRKITDNLVGDFVKDFRRDAKAPDPQSLDELLFYVSMRSTNPEVLKAARKAWKEWGGA